MPLQGRPLPQGSATVPPTLHGDGIEFLENQAVKSKMRILVSNDDGVDAAGIRMLAAVLREAGHEVTVVAPDRDRSGASASTITPFRWPVHPPTACTWR